MKINGFILNEIYRMSGSGTVVGGTLDSERYDVEDKIKEFCN